MSVLALDLPRAIALAPFTPTGGRPTLDEILASVWEGLAADRTVSCPACGGAMAPRSRSGPGPVGGRCTACGSALD